MSKSKAALIFEKQEYEVLLATVPDEPKKSSTLSVFGDGVFLLRKNPIGTFFKKINQIGFPSLPDGPEASFTMAMPKMPMSILQQQVSFYRDVMKKYNDAEAYTLILWDKQDEKYVVVCPKQKIAKANVRYDLEDEYPGTRYLQVVSCHSHNSMIAKFSSTDDADEKGDMLYMVMGELNKPIPKYSMRARLAGQTVKSLTLADVFEITDADWAKVSPGWVGNMYPTEWLAKLNVAGEYISIHALQNTRTPRDSNFRVTTYDPGKDPRQMSFDDYTNWQGDEGQSDTLRLRMAAIKFINSLHKTSPEDALEELLDDIIDAGFADELGEAFMEVTEPYDSDFQSFANALSEDEDWMNTYVLDPDERTTFDHVNDWIALQESNSIRK